MRSTVPDSTGQPVTLSEVLSRPNVDFLVLFFYPKAMTTGCTQQACSFRDSIGAFKPLKAEVFGVSRDSPEKNAEFQTKHSLPFRLLCDQNKELHKQFKVGSAMLGLTTERVTYVVDKSGKVQLAFNALINAKEHMPQAISCLRRLTGTQ
eukprot:tig00001224_g7640.t1